MANDELKTELNDAYGKLTRNYVNIPFDSDTVEKASFYAIRITSGDKAEIVLIETNSDTHVSYVTHFTIVDSAHIAETVVRSLNAGRLRAAMINAGMED